MMNPAFAKFFLPWVIGGAAIFCIIFALRLTVGDNLALQILTLTTGVAVILALLIFFSWLKKKL
jgi:hypothetical protein